MTALLTQSRSGRVAFADRTRPTITAKSQHQTLAAKIAPTPAPPRGSFWNGRTMDHLFQEFPIKVREAEEMCVSLVRTLRALVECNVNMALAGKFLDAVGVPVAKSFPALSMVEIARSGEQQAWTKMRDSLVRYVADGLAAFDASLELLRAAELVGGWTGSQGIYEFSFYRFRVREEVIESRDTGATTETEYLQTLLHRKEVHEIRQGRQLPVTDKTVRMPKRVRRLVDSLCPHHKDQAFILTGQEMFRRVIEQEIATSRRTEVTRNLYLPDPCLVLGSYVLAGWTDEDIEEEKQQVARLHQRLSNIGQMKADCTCERCESNREEHAYCWRELRLLEA